MNVHSIADGLSVLAPTNQGPGHSRGRTRDRYARIRKGCDVITNSSCYRAAVTNGNVSVLLRLVYFGFDRI